jgi:hypothetical protein
MSIPKRKNNINVYPQSELTERRKELLERITKSDTFLPDPIFHDDLDMGMLEFVKENFKITSDGEQIPIYKRLLTIQRWGEFSNNWEFADEDGNQKLPFIVIIRKPEGQPGTNPSLQRTIPDRRPFFYASVPTWDGNQIGADVYKIPQPVAIDLTFDVSIICTKFRDVNKFNKIVLQKFSSRQSYTSIKGHYIPIILDSISDSTPMDTMDGRRFYIQNYTFTMLGLLIDDEEFEVKPAINRLLLMTEFIQSNNYNRKYVDTGIELTITEFTATSGQTIFNVGEVMDVLILVTVNDMVKELGTDYYHVTTTSRITFATGLTTNDVVSITYFKSKDRKFTDETGKELNTFQESFSCSGLTTVYETIKPIKNLVCLDIDKYVKNEVIDFEITGMKEFTLTSIPSSGSTVSVLYLY